MRVSRAGKQTCLLLLFPRGPAHLVEGLMMPKAPSPVLPTATSRVAHLAQAALVMTPIKSTGLALTLRPLKFMALPSRLTSLGSSLPIFPVSSTCPAALSASSARRTYLIAPEPSRRAMTTETALVMVLATVLAMATAPSLPLAIEFVVTSTLPPRTFLATNTSTAGHDGARMLPSNRGSDQHQQASASR